MTIDERLEAIAQSVELIASLRRDYELKFQEREKQIDRMFQLVAAQFQQVALQSQQRDEQYQERFQENEKRLAQLMDTMNRFGRVLEISAPR